MGAEKNIQPDTTQPATPTDLAVLIMAAKSTASHWLAGNTSLLQHARARTHLFKFLSGKSKNT